MLIKDKLGYSTENMTRHLNNQCYFATNKERFFQKLLQDYTLNNWHCKFRSREMFKVMKKLIINPRTDFHESMKL